MTDRANPSSFKKLSGVSIWQLESDHQLLGHYGYLLRSWNGGCVPLFRVGCSVMGTEYRLSELARCMRRGITASAEVKGWCLIHEIYTGFCAPCVHNLLVPCDIFYLICFSAEMRIHWALIIIYMETISYDIGLFLCSHIHKAYFVLCFSLSVCLVRLHLINNYYLGFTFISNYW